MTVAEAKLSLPALNLIPETGFVDLRLAKVGTDTVTYLGCSLTFTLKFFRDRLDQVEVRAASGDACHETIERYLTARYGDPNIPAPCPNIISRQWSVPGTRVSYSYSCDPSRRDGMFIAFYELTDISGRVAEADRNRAKNCQLIFAEVLPASNGDGASDPVVSPDLPELGCDGSNYPAVSLRLPESGAPVISVRVSAAGSVEDAQLVASSGKPRLDNAVIALAQKKLKFIPAMRDGNPAEAVREIRVTFSVLSPLRGLIDFASPIYTCKDGSTQFFPCYGPFPALAAAPAKNGAKLTVTSTDIREGANLSADLTFAGANISPALNWTAGPAGTQSYALIVEDPSPSSPAIIWMVFDIPASATGLPQGVPNDLRVPNPADALNAKNAYGPPGYQQGNRMKIWPSCCLGEGS